MDLLVLKAYALRKMEEYGLLERGWSFEFDGASTRFGLCHFGRKVISVSEPLVLLNAEPECRETVLHEIAHALAGPRAGHGPNWAEACRRVGVEPKPCFRADDVEMPPPKYWAVCPSCGSRAPYYRRPSRRSACTACCRQYAGGRFDERFLLQLRDAVTDKPVARAATPSTRTDAQCPGCGQVYAISRRARKPRACAACCRKHAGGRFDARFVLKRIGRG